MDESKKQNMVLVILAEQEDDDCNRQHSCLEEEELLHQSNRSSRQNLANLIRMNAAGRWASNDTAPPQGAPATLPRTGTGTRTRTRAEQQEEEQELRGPPPTVGGSITNPLDVLSSPYAFDEHIFRSDFPRCCRRHACEGQLLEEEQEEDEEGEKVHDHDASSTRENHIEQEQVTSSINPAPEQTTSMSSTTSMMGEEEAAPKGRDDDDGGMIDYTAPRHADDSSTMEEARSILSQINEILALMDDAEAHKALMRIERKLQRNWAIAGDRTEHSRKQVLELKKRLFK